MKCSDSEWAVLEVLWAGGHLSLKQITQALAPRLGWNKNTVYTYLTRMEGKGLVAIDRTLAAPYAAAVSRESCAKEEREALLNRVYCGAAGDLIAAFLKESPLSAEETARLRKLLDEMEV